MGPYTEVAHLAHQPWPYYEIIDFFFVLVNFETVDRCWDAGRKWLFTLEPPFLLKFETHKNSKFFSNFPKLQEKHFITNSRQQTITNFKKLNNLENGKSGLKFGGKMLNISISQSRHGVLHFVLNLEPVNTD